MSPVPFIRKPAATAPTLPPAPMMPATPPSARLSMKGTSAYVAPHAMWVNRPKTSMAMTAYVTLSTFANHSRPTPSPIISMNSRVTRLFRLPRRANLSDSQPPRARANRASRPKLPAARPADFRDRPKWST